MPPVSSPSCAENEVRFPARFAKNRTSSVVWGIEHAHRHTPTPVFSFVCPATTNQESAGRSQEPERAHCKRAKHSSTITRACGRLLTDQLQSVKKSFLSCLRRTAHGFPAQSRLSAGKIRNTAPLGNHEIAEPGFQRFDHRLRFSRKLLAELGDTVSPSWFGKEEALPFRSVPLSQPRFASSARATARLQIFSISDCLCHTRRHNEVLLFYRPPLGGHASRQQILQGRPLSRALF